MSKVLVVVIAFYLGVILGIYVSQKHTSEPTYQDGYKQGQIDCIKGRVKYTTDTTITYIEIP